MRALKMRRNFCQACSFARHGVKTRIAIEHTCDGSNIPVSPNHPYIPKREELDMYLKRLEELMKADEEVFNSGKNPIQPPPSLHLPE